MLKILKITYLSAKGLLLSSFIIIPLFIPFFFIVLSEVPKAEKNDDVQIVIERNALEEDLKRFYPRKIFQIGVFVDDITNINFEDYFCKSKFTFWAKNFFNRSYNDRSQIGTNPFIVINADDISIDSRSASYIDNFKGETQLKSEGDPFVSYVSFSARGNLNQKFYLRHYPFDEHQLKIIVEPGYYTAKDMLLGIDPNSAISGDINLDNWKITSFKGSSELHTKKSDFSDPELIKNGVIWNVVPRATFSIFLRRNPLSHLLKEMLPLLILLIIAYSNFFVDPSYFDAKSAVAITCFLACTALHWTSGSELPGVGYITAMDEFFLYSYSLLLLVTAEAVVSHYLLNGTIGRTDPAIVKNVKLHPWFRLAIPTLRVISPVYLAGSWYYVVLKHIR
jgi:hypothetical protein